MSNFLLSIELDNAAFEGNNCADEVAAILRAAADKIEGTPRDQLEYGAFDPRDVNGNCVGTAVFEIDEDDEEEDYRNERFHTANKFLSDQLTTVKLKTVAETLGIMVFEVEERRTLIGKIATRMVDDEIDRDDILAMLHGE